MPPPETMPTKAELRAKYRAARRAVDAESRQHHDQAINSALEALVDERNAGRVAGYLAFDGEPDISAALGRLNHAGVTVHLPVIGAEQGRDTLSFRHWPAGGGDAPAGELRRNTLGIREPVVGDSCPVADLDIVFLPLVAWDERGGRLGMGAGYYDRALAGVADRDKPVRIGIAFQAQRAETLPMTETDVPLHAVLTERGLFTCRP